MCIRDSARALHFVQVLRRLRDLRWTLEDYYWLCKRKKSKLSLQERVTFHNAPVIMDFRRITEKNPEDNCTFYNRVQLRVHAKEKKVPVARFEALHEGITQDAGLKIAEENFNGTPNVVEVAKEARVLLIQNLCVPYGLMNGTRGDIVDILYAPGTHPNHQELRHRMPACLIIDFPKYKGPSYFNLDQFPDRATWLPLLLSLIHI